MSTAKIREAIEKTTATLAQHPEKARVKSAPATALLEEGLRCKVTGPAGELIHTDMPPGMGGNASAPNPAWFMRAALASCNATGIATQAAKAGIQLTRLEVLVTSETDSRGVLGLDDAISAAMQSLRIQVKVSAPDADPAELRKIVNWVCSHSPVGCTDPKTASVDIEIGP